MGFLFDEENYRLTYGGTLVYKPRSYATLMHALCRDVAGCPSNGLSVECSLWSDDHCQDENRSRVQKSVCEFNKRQVVAWGHLLTLSTVKSGRMITVNYDRVENGQ